jgi:ATP-dependent Clp protease ATP-binding subunit ClpA
MAEEGKLDPVVGREKESNVFLKFWAVVKKQPLVNGEPGLENQQLLKVSVTHHSEKKFHCSTNA